MASVRTSPCNWPLAHCGEPVTGEEVCSSLSALNPEMRELVEEMAVSYLWNWTKQLFGTCPVTIRPCQEQCSSQWTTYRGRGGFNNYLPWTEGNPGPLNPALFAGQWYNLGCGGCDSDPCSCSFVPEVDLLGPVDSVTQILINGVVLDPAKYRVDNYRYLVRVDGGQWPVCQNMTDDPTDLAGNSFEVTYNIGAAVPAGGRIAAGKLACEIAKMACGASGCQLPQRVQSVTRQGVNMTLLDSFDMLYKQGVTGLTLVDMWVASVNAPIAKTGFRVASPDRRATRRTTG